VTHGVLEAELSAVPRADTKTTIKSGVVARVAAVSDVDDSKVDANNAKREAKSHNGITVAVEGLSARVRVELERLGRDHTRKRLLLLRSADGTVDDEVRVDDLRACALAGLDIRKCGSATVGRTVESRGATDTVVDLKDITQFVKLNLDVEVVKDRRTGNERTSVVSRLDREDRKAAAHITGEADRVEGRTVPGTLVEELLRVTAKDVHVVAVAAVNHGVVVDLRRESVCLTEEEILHTEAHTADKRRHPARLEAERRKTVDCGIRTKAHLREDEAEPDVAHVVERLRDTVLRAAAKLEALSISLGVNADRNLVGDLNLRKHVDVRRGLPWTVKHSFKCALGKEIDGGGRDVIAGNCSASSRHSLLRKIKLFCKNLHSINLYIYDKWQIFSQPSRHPLQKI